MHRVVPTGSPVCNFLAGVPALFCRGDYLPPEAPRLLAWTSRLAC